jgi:chromosome segregation protein
MKLRRIQLVGFKSFKDKVTIELSDDMNGIVGPNGCGKSNVVDALKWAMGDMSPKSLRGSSLSDVIFAGSENHRPGGMAEVTLTFENELADEAAEPAEPTAPTRQAARAEQAAREQREARAEQHMRPDSSEAVDSDDAEDADEEGADESAPVWNNDSIPREYREMPEISITRRLHRSGDSEYLINNVPCRLMDIQNLLAGTGLGKQGYSIIEQGQISFAVSAKPSERRLIIEEASGITRYKAQRDRSQRKLDRTEQNLLRVRDVVREVDKQLRSLERQARRAERHKELTEELRTLEIAQIVDKRGELADRAAKLRKRLQEGRTDVEKARSSLKKLEGKLSNQKVEAFQAEKKHAELTEHFYKLDTRLNLAKSNRKHLVDSVEDAKARHQEALRERESQQKRKEGLSVELERVRAELANFDESPEDTHARIKEAEDELAAAKKRLREAERERNETRSKLDEARSKLRRLDDRREWLSSQRDELAQRKRQVTEQIDGVGREVEDLRRGLNRLAMDVERADGEVEQKREDRQSAEMRLSTARERQKESRAELEQIRSERIEVSARVDSLEAMRRRGDGYAQGVQEVLEWAAETGREDVLGPVGDFLSVEEGDEAAVAAFLGDRLGDVVVTHREAALEALAMLTDDEVGRAGFYVLSAPDADPREEVGALLEKLAVVDSLAELPPRSERDSDKIAWASTSGDIEFDDGRIVGGHVGDQAESVLRQARELEQLSERLSKLQLWEEDAKEEYEIAEEDVELGQERLAKARQAVEQASLEKRRIEQELSSEQRELERTEKRLRRMKAEVEPIEERHQELAKEADGLGEQRQSLEDALPELEQRLETSTEAFEIMQSELEAQQSAVTERKVELAEAKERRRNLQESVKRLERSLESTGRQIEKLEREAKAQAERLEEFEEKSDSTTREVAELDTQYKEAKEAAEAARQKLDAVNDEVRELEVEIVERRRDVEQNVGSVQQTEMSLRELGVEIEHVDRNLRERFELSIPEARQIAEEVELEPKQRDKRVQKLKRKIDKMGAVNPMAVDEYEEARERKEFLEEQQLDLEASVDDLRKAIRRMDRESKKRFRDTFDAVNAKFQEFFPRLFRGGHAKLKLTDPDNVLESGVDIEVSPPGKRLQNVSLLSGGEKALTAVSLIFAIFSLKPTPFSVLDEVDAPLDEANVGRFAEMVRELSQQSQMIVITHNRRTMESCDTLYGVTMEEPGVSKIVSVRLHEIDDRLAS